MAAKSFIQFKSVQVTIANPGGTPNFTITSADLAGGSHFLIMGCAYSIGTTRTVLYADNLSRPHWANQASVVGALASFELFLWHPTGAIDQVNLVPAGTQLGFGAVFNQSAAPATMSVNLAIYG